MAIIYNSDLTQNIVKSIRGSTARDKIPNEIAEKVLPVIDVNPYPNIICNFVKRASLTNTTSATIATTETDRDTFIQTIYLSYIKDATSTATSIRVNGVINGATTVLLSIAALTLTAASGNNAISLNKPLKLDRNTNITLTSDTGVANIKCEAGISGFTEEI